MPNSSSDDGSDGLNDLSGFDGDDGAWSADNPAHGSSLPPFRPSPWLQRTRFVLDVPNAPFVTIDIDHLSGRASFYREDRLVESSDLPARFALGADRIDVVASKHGMQRIHLVRADGSQQRLEPSPGTPEHWRAQLGQRRPTIARVLATGAVIVLIINLILLAPQLLEVVTHLPLWTNRFAPFVSPLDLPVWANTALTVTAALAGIERALSFRHHRLLDVESDGIES